MSRKINRDDDQFLAGLSPREFQNFLWQRQRQQEIEGLRAAGEILSGEKKEVWNQIYLAAWAAIRRKAIQLTPGGASIASLSVMELARNYQAGKIEPRYGAASLVALIKKTLQRRAIDEKKKITFLAGYEGNIKVYKQRESSFLNAPHYWGPALANVNPDTNPEQHTRINAEDGLWGSPFKDTAEAAIASEENRDSELGDGELILLNLIREHLPYDLRFPVDTLKAIILGDPLPELNLSNRELSNLRRRVRRLVRTTVPREGLPRPPVMKRALNPRPQKMCVVCGEVFGGKREDAKYCSGRCREAARRQRQAPAQAAD